MDSEEDEHVRRACVQSLQHAGFYVGGFGSVEAAAKAIVGDATGVIVSHIRRPAATALDLLPQCRERTPDVPVVLVTG
ncbi:sigma-54-dependent Fis family transcriptional regulator, partial [Burkholderia pseudomallei]